MRPGNGPKGNLPKAPSRTDISNGRASLPSSQFVEVKRRHRHETHRSLLEHDPVERTRLRAFNSGTRYQGAFSVLTSTPLRPFL